MRERLRKKWRWKETREAVNCGEILKSSGQWLRYFASQSGSCTSDVSSAGRVLFPSVQRHAVLWKSTDVSEEHDTSFTLLSWLDYSSILKMEATCCSETSVGFQQIIRRYIPEGRTLHSHRCENARSYITSGWFHLFLTAIVRQTTAHVSSF
jgi:hypothetical protein